MLTYSEQMLIGIYMDITATAQIIIMILLTKLLKNLNKN